MVAGAPTPGVSLQQRVKALEGEIVSLRNQLSDRRLGETAATRHVRLAVTTDVASYPSETGNQGEKPVYPINFLDATFTKVADWETPTVGSRATIGSEPQAFALSFSSSFIEPGTVVIAVWQRAPTGLAAETGGEWFIFSSGGGGDQMQLLIATEPLYPGFRDVPAKLMIFNATTGEWEKDELGPEQRIFDDSLEHSLCVTNETVWCRRRPQSAQTGIYPEWDVVCVVGTNRRVKLDVDIDCGESGIADVWSYDRNAAQGERCVGEESAAFLDVCNNWGWRRKIRTRTKGGQGGELQVHFARGPKSTWDEQSLPGTWFIESPPRALTGYSFAAEDKCGDSQIAITGGVIFYEWKDSECGAGDDSVTTVANPDAHLVNAGDRLELVYSAADDSWSVVDVQKKARMLVEDVKGDSIICPTYNKVRTMIGHEASDACPPDEDKPFLFSYSITAVDEVYATPGDPQTGTCPEFHYRTSQFCALSPQLPFADTTWFRPIAVNVMNNLDLFEEYDMTDPENPILTRCGVKGTVVKVCALSGPMDPVDDVVDFLPVVVVDDVRENATGIEEHKITIYTPCSVDQGTEQTVTYVECEEQDGGTEILA